MSINLGIYDFFSFIVPGLLYLYAFNEISRSIGWKFVEISSWFVVGQTPSFLFFVPIFVGAYLLGHLLDPISQKFFDLFPKSSRRLEGKEWYLNPIKGRYPNLSISFVPKDRTLLFALIRQRNIEMARILDSFSANSIMLRNTAFGFVFLSFANLILFFSAKDINHLIIALIAFVLCLLSIINSNQYREWFIKDIFRASLDYGVSVEEVVAYSLDKDKTKNSRSQNTKKRLEGHKGK